MYDSIPLLCHGHETRDRTQRWNNTTLAHTLQQHRHNNVMSYAILWEAFDSGLQYLPIQTSVNVSSNCFCIGKRICPLQTGQ